MYKKVNTSLDFVEREKEILDFWSKNDVFNKSTLKNKDNQEFSFYDGPPTANGKPHIGHILTRVIKDIIPRYKTMKGFFIRRKAGWDTHGLPVELEVEKSLGLDGKQEIEKYGVEPFIKKCKESVWKYKGDWEKMSNRVGYWVDMDDPYITYDDNYIESVWWSLKEIDKKGLIYKGHKIVPYCPRCGTALSSHEVAQGYKDIKEKSIYVKFKLADEENAYFLAWTTTPWTLPSNVALCMNPKENYVKLIAKDGYTYILAEALAPSLFAEYSVVSVKKGAEYEHTKYEPLFDYLPIDTTSHFITCDSYVTLTDGTGIVHIAPAFGEDDAKVGRKYGLPFVQMVNDRGLFNDEAYDIKGVFAKDADALIINNLRLKGLLFSELMYEHSYPFCWRCDTSLLYYARSSWFIKVTALKDELLKNNYSVNWLPPSIGPGRMGNFLENLIDWGISRERYWGTPLPIWVCPDCGEKITIGSREELNKLAGINYTNELHKPYIDAVTIPCKCGSIMTRTPEVIDCWYDSGSMPFAQWHYPFENQDIFNDVFPADFISEAVDQTRGWFYTLLAISTLLFNKSPFKNCIVLGHVNDKEGNKMSKHKGNVVDPWTILDKQGADAVRWYFYVTSNPWLPTRFYEDAVSEAQRKFMGTLWNTYAFYVLYADIDKFNPSKYSLKDAELTIMDKWILSRLNSLIELVDKNLSEYRITESARAIQDYADILSNWYVRRSRERYWAKGMEKDKIAAYLTLHHILVTLSKICAPFVPFMSEQIYLNLVPEFYKDAPISVHMTDFPIVDNNMIDSYLEQDMEFVLNAVMLGRAARNKSNIKNRQPLNTMFISSVLRLNDESIISLIAEELNIKNYEFIKDDNQFVSYEIKPQLKTIGPKYGSLLNAIREYLANADTLKIINDIKATSSHKVELKGYNVEFLESDLLISTKSKSGYVAESNAEMTVILDTNLDQELINEGMARELVSKIQTMRKEAGYEVTDHIKLAFIAEDTIKAVLLNDKTIVEDVLCDELIEGHMEGYSKDWDIIGYKTIITIKRL